VALKCNVLITKEGDVAVHKKKVLMTVIVLLLIIISVSLIRPQWFAKIKLTDSDNDGNPEYSVKNYSLRRMVPGEWTAYALDDYYGWVRCGQMHGPEVSSPLAISIRPFHNTKPREVDFSRPENALEYKLEVEVSFHNPGPIILEKEFVVQ